MPQNAGTKKRRKRAKSWVGGREEEGGGRWSLDWHLGVDKGGKAPKERRQGEGCLREWTLREGRGKKGALAASTPPPRPPKRGQW